MPEWDEPVYEHGRDVWLLNTNVTPENGPVRVAVNGVVVWSSDDVPESHKTRLEASKATNRVAWDQGWDAHYQEHLRQKRDPEHPITRNNPFRTED